MNNKLLRPCIVLAVLSAVMTSASVYLAVENSRLKIEAENRNTQISEETNVITETTTETSVIETTAAETETDIADSENVIYIYDNGIETIEYPPIEGARMNDYDMALLETNEKKQKTLYDSNGNKRSRFGIDVSSYQCDIDWEAVAADGVEFAIIRMGYRGYETGNICQDKYFKRNIEGAKAAGLDVGVYFYSQAITVQEAEEEADYVISVLSEYPETVTMPVIFDWEFPTDEDPARTDNMDGETQTACCEAFCEKIKQAGYDTMYYATINTALFRYDMGLLSDYPLWLAEYHADCDFVYDYKMWQYSCSGVVDGIEGLVDLNIWIDE